jgi:hypothetical protein
MANIPSLSNGMGSLQALSVDDMTGVKDLVDDYLERNQDSFDEFDNPDDLYSDIIDELDGLEVMPFPVVDLVTLCCVTVKIIVPFDAQPAGHQKN